MNQPQGLQANLLQASTGALCELSQGLPRASAVYTTVRGTNRPPAQPGIQHTQPTQHTQTPKNPYRCLAVQTANRLDQLQGTALASNLLAIPSQFAARQSLNGRFELSTRAWDLSRNGQPVAQLRMVLIEGTTNEIINTWIFPYSAAVTPVFAAELIAMANAPRLTFMDIQVPGLEPERQLQVAECSRPNRQKYTDLLIDEQPPAWAVDATQGNFLFSRAESAATFPRIQSAYMSLLNSYLECLNECPGPIATEAAQHTSERKLKNYQMHHMQHSPGGNFLSKVFGVDWTNKFLDSFLFTLPTEVDYV